MFTSKRARLAAAGFGLALGGCAELVSTTPAPVEQVRSINGVKWVNPSVTDPRDSVAWGKPEYEIGPTSRLLMRLEDMVSKNDSIVTAPDKPITVRIYLPSIWAPTGALPDAEAAASVMQVCPITKNWMMHATWYRAFPHSEAGDWTMPGGDFDTACSKNPKVERDTMRSLVYLKFDVTQWFLDYPRGRGIDYGLVLRSDQTVRVFGETSPSASPRMTYTAR